MPTMNPQIEKILKPISPDRPCGEDLSNEPVFDEFEAVIKGKPEVEMGRVKRPAEPPEWMQVKDMAIAILGRSKHLRPAVALTCALLKVDGLAGFNEGLVLLRDLVEKYWATLYPLLDPEDNNDPMQRLNILGALAAPRQAVSGWIQFAEYLCTTPLCRPKGGAPVTFEMVVAAGEAKSSSSDAPVVGPNTDQIAGAFRACDPEDLKEQGRLISECLESVQAIDKALTEILGAGGTVSFEVLETMLQQMNRTVASYIPGASPATQIIDGGESSGSGALSDGGSSTVGGIVVTGSIRSRDDVVRVLDNVCEYYRQVEPGSPVPFVLRRAQKMAMMNFVEVVQELGIAGPDQLRPAMGSAVDIQPPVS